MKKNLIIEKRHLRKVMLTALLLLAAGCGKSCIPENITGPEFKLAGSYQIVQPGCLKAEDYVENMADILEIAEVSIGFLSFVKREDLTVMSDEELGQNAVSGEENLLFEEGMKFSESMDVTEDGVYDAQIGVMDTGGNIHTIACTFYVDGTAPRITGLKYQEIEVEDPSAEFEISVDNLKIYDAFDGDLMDADQSELEIVSNKDGAWTEKGFSETFTATVTTADRAGNFSECSVQILAFWDSTGAVQELFTDIQAKESADTPEKNVSVSNGYRQDLARQMLDFVNSARTEEGLNTLSWDSSLEDLAMGRAQQIVLDFSHNGLPDWAGENIFKGGIDNAVVRAHEWWMNSEGHRANILYGPYTRIGIACYCHEGKFYWVENFGL